MDFTDDTLKRATAGDSKAFESLLRGIEKLLYNIAYRMVGPADAEDVCQEAIIKIWKNIYKVNSASYFRNWACVIVTNTCYDELRKRRGKAAVSLDSDDEAAVFAPVSDEGNPLDALVKSESFEEIEKAIFRLPTNQRLIVALRDIEGLSYGDLSAILKVPEGTVKSRLNRARAALKKLLTETEQKSV